MEISRGRKDHLSSKLTSMTEQASAVALRRRTVRGIIIGLSQFRQIHSVYNLENSKLPFSVHSYRRLVALEESIESSKEEAEEVFSKLLS
jgi:hypothetical protein